MSMMSPHSNSSSNLSCEESFSRREGETGEQWTKPSKMTEEDDLSSHPSRDECGMDRIDVQSLGVMKQKRESPSADSISNALNDMPNKGNTSAFLRRLNTTGDIDRTKTTANYMDYKYSRSVRLSVEHENDKNDNGSNLTFKEFRRQLSVLKRSIINSTIEEDLLSLDDSTSDNTDEEREEANSYKRVTFSTPSIEAKRVTYDRPSLYAQGTSVRSMRNISRISLIPNEDSHTNLDKNRHKQREWLKSFYHTDPRWQICNFFDDLAYEGVKSIDESGRMADTSAHLPPIMRGFSRVGVFSVWRPTSKEAIRRMMTGEGTGKGMDIKGKSATRGKWSGYVPFLQIHNNEDKMKVGSLHADTRVRVFYPNKHSRDRAFLTLSMVRDHMVDIHRESQRIIREVEQMELSLLEEELHKSSRDLTHIPVKQVFGNARKRLTKVFDYSKFEAALDDKHHNSMDDATVHKIDDYASADKECYGLDIPEKLFWETFVSKQDISREEGSEYDFGRPSMPEFQAMNLESLRKAPKSGPRPVLWHAGCESNDAGEEMANTLCPYGLLMAYEENEDDDGKVTPVVSDFDCFLVGTRGVQYSDPLEKQELSVLKWCVDEIESVLDNAKDGEEVSWTRQWLDVKKKYAFDPRFKVPMPKMGYADPRSHAMMKGAVYSLRGNGAVRHGPECFNYSFPQPMDDKFLVISDMLPGKVPWKYVGNDELKEILSEKIDDGFAFPLNPKWILCDEGWKDLYDKLLASNSANVPEAMDIWYPADVRDRIATISAKHPNGFGSRKQPGIPRRRQAKRGAITQIELEEISAELAELQLERYKHARAGMKKLRTALLNTSEKPTKRKKSKAFNFFTSALVMLRLGKENDDDIQRHEENPHFVETVTKVTKKQGWRGTRRVSFDSDQTSTSATSTSSSPEAYGIDWGREHGQPCRRSLSRFIRKRLSLSITNKKMRRRSSM